MHDCCLVIIYQQEIDKEQEQKNKNKKNVYMEKASKTKGKSISILTPFVEENKTLRRSIYFLCHVMTTQ